MALIAVAITGLFTDFISILPAAHQLRAVINAQLATVGLALVEVGRELSRST
jgi:hypothetical protein